MSDRLKREKDFHEARFSDGKGARNQDKYYIALRQAQEQLDAAVTSCALAGGFGLEVGCSTGQNLYRLLLQNHFTAHGIDISDAAVSAAKGLLKNFVPLPELKVMDANCLSYKDGMFDFCFGSGVLHHLDLPESVYEMRRVLNHGGRFLFLEPLATNPIIQIYRFLTPRDRSADETPLTAAHLGQIKKIFPDASFAFFGFLTIPCVVLNKWPLVQRPIMALASFLDKILFALPGAWRLAWCVVIQGVKG